MDSRIDKIYEILIEQADAQSERHAETSQQLGRMQGQIEAILAEARKTNGRVTLVESEVQSLRNWRWYLMGGGTVIVALVEVFKEKLKF